MDKYEYRVRAEEINALIDQGKYADAVKIADSIDWRRVKSVMMLCKISELYKMNRRYEESKEILLLAYERHPGARKIVYSLCELCIKLENVVEAVEYYKEFVQVAPRDTGKYILQYRLYEAQDVSLEERIAVLEEYKRRDYRERWAYELAYLYHRIGLATRCVEECDELILWFGEGKYVVKAMELKQLHEPLTVAQQEKYDKRRTKQNVNLNAEEEEEEAVLPIEIKSVDPTDAKTAEIPAKEIDDEVSRMEAEDAETVDSLVKHGDEMDIQVKTMDMGEYNTINLQEELAKNLAKIMQAEDMVATDATVALPVDTIMGQATREMVTSAVSDNSIINSILSPELQKTVELTPVMEEDSEPVASAEQEEEIENPEKIEDSENIEDPEKIKDPEKIEEPENMEATEYDSEETDFEETDSEESTHTEFDSEEDGSELEAVLYERFSGKPDAEDDLNEEDQETDMEEDMDEEDAIEIPEEMVPSSRVIPIITPPSQLEEQVARLAAQLAQLETKVVLAENIEKENIKTEQTEAEQEETLAEEAFESEQEEQVEKQITGQLSIVDIMSEWEETKKANEEKRMKDMRQKLLQQTGPMFSSFDAAIKESVQADLDMISPLTSVFEEKDSEEIFREMDEVVVDNPEEDLEENTEELSEEGIFQQNSGENSLETDIQIDTQTSEVEGMLAGGYESTWPLNTNAAKNAVVEEKTAEDITAAILDTASLASLVAEVLEESGVPEKKTPEPEVNRNLWEAEFMEVDPEDQLEVTENITEVMEPGYRSLTKEEKEMFGSIAQTREVQGQIARTLDAVTLTPNTGNIIITGDKGTGTTAVAKDIIRKLQMSDSNFSGKVAKITGSLLDKKDIAATIHDLENGALIVEKASELSPKMLEKMVQVLESGKEQGIVIVLEDSKEKADHLTAENPSLLRVFNTRIDIAALDNNGLVTYGKEYAREKEYTIDEMGTLALYTRITDMQTRDHSVTVEEVRQMIDDAIQHAEKKTVGHFVDVLLAKRYDEDDMIVLREKDFLTD